MRNKRISCPRKLNQETGAAILGEVRQQGVERGESVILDFSSTESLDSRGGAWLINIADFVRAHQGTVSWEGQRGAVADFLNLIGPSLRAAPPKRFSRFAPLEHIGHVTYNVATEVRDFFNLFVDSIYWTFVGPLEGRRFRWGLFMDEMHEMGVRAIPITCVMNFMLGLVIAMLSAAQLRQVGLNIYVADLVVIAFARELAAIMTAVVVSARTGAAITAELATMKVQEEIDALRGMGLNVAQFLVAPKVLALLVCMPCLVAIGLVAGVLGGTVWGVFVLEFDFEKWFDETLYAVTVQDLYQGFAKCFCFAVIIVLVGCHNGLRVEGGSRGVGLMTTRAVVMDAFFIVLVDMFFAALFYYVL